MKISNVMTLCPYTIKSTATLQEALDIMKMRNIRHLPVVEEDGGLIGMVTERDIKLSRFVCEAAKFCPTLGELCTNDPYVVGEETSVAEVVDHMIHDKTDCCLVVDGEGNFVGIFTTTDACKLVRMVFDDLSEEDSGATKGA